MDGLELELLLESIRRGFVVKGRTVAKLGKQFVITLPIEYNELWAELNRRGSRITVIIRLEGAPQTPQ
ncbi:MAG: hypothetical protein ACP5GZ_11225 [Vulcanisaeta sp.]|uniref:hypothetical protein n=1 Tax=Vulcanisaeta sp. TaxID=2020871 RepID=UPI003D0BBD66